ncbi:CotH kinase family protein [Flavobacterium defluvii]|uniref:Por secretion system C-terminal sorting domain-containing protein n=1 Tax=Flavobacterium defluvii TaxID=370979 RepID=A0A1M5MYS5_9FLAO|nr:CotH kinase family protein [Flavobacterium defluvii]SHG82355.1 Por secretion system C-terminal sorting domain-containing protein [Flavobacterium defluvii]
MIKHYFSKPYAKTFIVLIFFFSIHIKAQTFTDSNLPIVVINTDIDPNTNQPIEIPDDPKVLATMKIIKRPDGSRNYLTDINTAAYLNYNGRIGIELRGSTSQSLPKKPYGLTTLKANNTSNNNVSLLGMPIENDWILNSLAFDPSCIRDYLSYNLSRQIGDYASRTVYCEVVVNNEYKGLYILQEKIKSNVNRVNVIKMADTDNTLPNMSGGYITKADKTTGGDPVAWTMPSYIGSVDFIHELPKPENVTVQQNDYIKGQFQNLAATSNAHNTDLATGYPSVIDVPSFIDYMLLAELASNVDSYQFSTYFHKDKEGKLRAGPIWDFNLAYGNDLFMWGYDRSKYDVWQFSNGDNEGAKFWQDLYNDATYKCYFSKRWNELTQPGQPLNYNSLNQFIDETITYISEAKVRENQKWGTIPNDALEISNLKSFLSNRISWMTGQLGSFSSCSNVEIPSLVITKINYNPGVSASFPTSNDLEFIQIKNTGTTTVNLTGVYLRELGLSYQFPANSTLAANQEIYITSNKTTFESKYGITAFGQFSRNLSNTSQKIVLADGFGNTIDSVEYSNISPWPNADGNGSYLQLSSTDLDNALASSWTAVSDGNLSLAENPELKTAVLYPNPVNNSLTIQAEKPILNYKVYDVLGRLLYESKQDSNTIKTDWSLYPKGVYFISISNENGSSTKKIIKQ